MAWRSSDRRIAIRCVPLSGQRTRGKPKIGETRQKMGRWGEVLGKTVRGSRKSPMRGAFDAPSFGHAAAGLIEPGTSLGYYARSSIANSKGRRRA
jgi:hypothetical protein